MRKAAREAAAARFLYDDRAVTSRSLFLVCAVGCGGSAGPLPSMPPTSVTYGQTSLIVWVNPRVNDANDVTVPPPGTVT